MAQRSPQSTRKLHTFHGGIHLPDNKAQSNTKALQQASLPERLIVPLQQHIGEITEPLVKIGDRVLKGQQIARAQGYISAPVHAPTSGKVTDISPQRISHPSGIDGLCMVIECDGREEWCELPEPITGYSNVDPAELRERIRQSGIVGMGGAAFPTNVKLNPGPETWIKTLIINGAECEPFITCDDMLMRDHAGRIIDGIEILNHILKPGQILIGIEDNKPEAITAMEQAATRSKLDSIEVVTIPTLYPSGGEKQLIRILTGQEVPSGGIPAKIGIVCHNVGTTAAIADAVLEGKPLISRLVTVTGEGVGEPGNFETLIGTPANHLIEQAGGYTGTFKKLILGGPMMGFALHDDNAPLTKAGNCLLAASETEAPDPGPATPCIRCGQCAAACPVTLLPQQMYWYSRAKDLEKVQEYHLFDCIECGCCSHVCPAHIPLVQYFRYAKTESWEKEREKVKSEHARKRHEARVERLERLEAERQSKLKKKKAALARKKKVTAKRESGAGSDDADPKKAAIEAAKRRAAEKKAKLADAGVKPKNTENLTADQQNKIDQADARRQSGKSASTEDDKTAELQDD